MLSIFSGQATCSRVRRKQGFPGGNVKSSPVIQFDRQGDVKRRLRLLMKIKVTCFG